MVLLTDEFMGHVLFSKLWGMVSGKVLPSAVGDNAKTADSEQSVSYEVSV